MPSEPRTDGFESEILHIQGELTVFRAAELKPLILCRALPAAIDLSGVTEIDSAGVQLLLMARKAALAAHRPLQLQAPSAAVCEVFELLNLSGHFVAEPAATTAGA